MSSKEIRARPDLNPLAFPSDTTFRFLLLILAVVGTSLFAFQSLYLGRESVMDQSRAALRCMERSSSSAEVSACSESLNHATGTWIVAAFGAMVVVAFAVYLLMPSWRLRRRRLEPLSAEDAPEVVARLAELSREAGLQALPRFVWNPLNPAAGGLAFGRVGRRYVALGGGLVVTFYTDPAAFRAIVLHELGHLRNRDVDKAYFSMALWYSLLAVAVLPLLASLYGERLSYSWSIVWRLGALVVLVYLSRNGVLRAREAYADVRASQSDGGDDGLRSVIAALPVSAGGRWRRLLSVHPDPQARLAALDNTDLLFRPRLGEAFGAGVMLTLIYGQLALLIHYFDASLTGPYWLAALVVAPFCAAVVAVGIWRGAFLSLARPAATSSIWRVGVALGLGFLAGQLLSLLTITTGGESSFAQATNLPEIGNVVSSAMFGSGIAWVLLALLSLGLFVLWIDVGATVWLSRGGERTPRLAMAGGVVASGAVLTVWTGLFFLLHDVSVPVARQLTESSQEVYELVGEAIWLGPFFLFRFLWDGTGLVLASEWPVIPAFALLWAFPFAATARRRGREWPSWAFTGANRPQALQPQRLNLRRAIVIGLAAGLVAWVGILTLRAGIRASHGVEPPLTDEFFFGVFHWQLVLGMAAQTLAAAIAVVVCRSCAIVHGLLAGFVAGLVSCAALLSVRTIAGCLTPFSLESAPDCPTFYDGGTARSIYEQVLAQGSMLALTTSLVAYGLVWLVRRLRGANRSLSAVPIRGATR